MDKTRVLVVDDEASIRHVLNRVLEMNGCEVREAGSVEDAGPLLDDWEPEVALVDIVLPGKNGIQFLGEIKDRYPDVEVLVMTSNASADTALQAIRRGAHDYLQKPFDNLKQVWTNVQRALEKRNLVLKNRALVEEREQKTQRLSSSVALPRPAEGLPSLAGVQEVFDNVLSVAIHELDVDRASLMILDERTNELRIVASRGIPADVEDVRIPLGEGIAGTVAQTGETFLVTDVTKDARYESDRPHLSNSFVSAPIVFSVAVKSSRSTFGVINVTNRRSGKPFTSDDVAFLSGLAGQLGIVIERARQSDELHRAYESLKLTQEQLVFSERIKAVGQMAAGVAHDFNNVLSVILSRAEFALRRLHRDAFDLEAVRNDLETIVKTSLQGAEAIKRIQDYTRIRKDNPNSAVNLNDVIADAVEIARPKWKEQTEAEGRPIEVTFQRGDIPAVSGNVYELTQVVNNLIFNAVEAMPEGGSITIETSAGNGSVFMRVADTGTGMDAETQRRLFEPFFTTKEDGQGLGTSILFGIVSRHSGKITVDSGPGRGSTFTVRLPEAEVSASQPETEATEDRPFVSARILLVDDDEVVRETNAEILLSDDHEVMCAASGEEAIKLCHEQSFDLVVTDLSMPGMSGLDLARELKKVNRALPVLLFSGWAMQEQEEKVREAGIDHILVKPCLMEELLASIQKALLAARKKDAELTRA